jgi:hypothetical protein
MNEVNHPVDQILSRACKHDIDPSKKVRGEVCTAITGKSHMFISDIRSGFMLDGFFTCKFLSITSDTAMKLLYLILLTSSTTVLAKRVLHQSNVRTLCLYIIVISSSMVSMHSVSFCRVDAVQAQE